MDIESRLIQYNNSYHNGISEISDEEYDKLYDEYKKINPNSDLFKKIGSIPLSNKTKLPFKMPSLNKLKPEGLSSWFNKQSSNNFVISDKLDGKSVLVCTQPLKLYSRGDGETGQDITYLRDYLKDIKKIEEIKEKVIMRGELIITKENFKGLDFSTARNCVSGITNSTKNPKKDLLNKVDIVFYQYITESKKQMKISEQLSKLKELKLKVVSHTKLTIDKDHEEVLDNILKERRSLSEYDIDGIVCITDIENKYAEENPKNAIAYKAYKNNENVYKTKVIDVLWEPSKDCYFKPRIQVEPIVISGSKIEYATAFNAKYVVDNKLGPNSEIEITKGGDVIPHIVKVYKSTEPKLPDVKYKWNETKVDIYCDLDELKETNKKYYKLIKIKLLEHFFNTIKVSNLNEKTIKKIYKEGYTTEFKILKLIKSKDGLKVLSDIDGLGKKSSEKIITNVLNAIKNIDLVTLMDASYVFGRGFGNRKLSLIVNEIPDIIEHEYKTKELKKILIGIKGVEEKTATKFLNKLEDFKDYYNKSQKYFKLKEESKIESTGEFNDMKFVFSGIRDTKLEEMIESRGGKVTTSISKKSILICKDKESTTSKVVKSKELGNKIYNIKEFKALYKL